MYRRDIAPQSEFLVGETVYIYRRHRWKGVVVEKIEPKRIPGGWKIRVLVSWANKTKKIWLNSEDIATQQTLFAR